MLSWTQAVVAVSKARTVEEDQGYFTSYAHYGIHQEMLADKVIKGAKVLPLRGRPKKKIWPKVRNV